jgi:hypothetical protein
MSDEVNRMIQETTASLEDSKKVLQQLSNEIAALVEIVQPALEKQIGAIRSARMTTVTEIRETLTSLREIRKFFLESDYESEMQRLQRFVDLCKQIQHLKNEGVLDVMADTAIRLGIKQETPRS